MSSLKEAEVASFLAAGALRFFGCDGFEGVGVLFELLLELLEVGDGLFSGAGYGFLAVGVVGVAGLFVFLEDVGAMH